MTHLEVMRAATWLGKQMRYGSDPGCLKHTMPYRSLCLGERLQIHQACVTACHYTAQDRLALLLTLGLGGMSVEIGKILAHAGARRQRLHAPNIEN